MVKHKQLKMLVKLETNFSPKEMAANIAAEVAAANAMVLPEPVGSSDSSCCGKSRSESLLFHKML
jgi:hypothetical protein